MAYGSVLWNIYINCMYYCSKLRAEIRKMAESYPDKKKHKI